MGARLYHRRVVLAVRDPALFRTLVRSLELEGASVLPAGNRAELQRLIVIGRPEICLVDADLDGLDLGALRSALPSDTQGNGESRQKAGTKGSSGPLILLISADPVLAPEGTLDGFPVLAVPFDRRTLIDRIEFLAGGG